MGSQGGTGGGGSITSRGVTGIKVYGLERNVMSFIFQYVSLFSLPYSMFDSLIFEVSVVTYTFKTNACKPLL
jgi:hypothetical protein